MYQYIYKKYVCSKLFSLFANIRFARTPYWIHVHMLSFTRSDTRMTEFSRSSARDSISIIEMGERIEFTSVYRQDFLAGSRH